MSAIVVEQYIILGTFTALLYDSVITKDNEIIFFWSNPWNVNSAVFFVLRYVGLLGGLAFVIYTDFGSSVRICEITYWIRTLSTGLVIVLMEYIILIRVLALYQANRVLNACLKILFATVSVGALSMVVYADLKSSVQPVKHSFSACNVQSDVPLQIVVISRVLPLMHGLILLVLALRKAHKYLKFNVGFRGSHLVKILVRDQARYYVFVVVYCILTLVSILVTLKPGEAAILNSLGDQMIISFAGCRILINLKEEGEKDANGGIVNIVGTISSIQFVQDTASSLL